MEKKIQFSIILILTLKLFGCNLIKQGDSKTWVTIQDGKWFINNEITNQGSPAEGLLMNVRMVNSVFEDLGPLGHNELSGFDPMQNTNLFASKIPEYVKNGINAFTISLQGGFPGYEGAVNSAFLPDGTLREEYLQRVEKIIQTCDANHAVVILSCFYQRQHSNYLSLNGKEGIKKALTNIVEWISQNKYSNVLLEVSNEYRHGGYRNWPDGDWLVSEEGQIELIQLAKRQNPSLLVSTSGMGNGKLDEQLALAADFLLVHFNNTSLKDYGSRIKDLKKYGKPIVCNEDDKLKQAAEMALSFSVLNGCGWGYMNSPKNQNVPFEFKGINDDPIVYNMFRNVTTPGYLVDSTMFKQTFVIITSPNDGQIFTEEQNLRIQISLVNPSDSTSYYIDILSNNEVISRVNEKLRANWLMHEPGNFILKAIVKNSEGKELYRSPQVDIIVKPKE